MTQREALCYIKQNDRNGFETLEGDETLEQLLEAVEAIKENEEKTSTQPGI